MHRSGLTLYSTNLNLVKANSSLNVSHIIMYGFYSDLRMLDNELMDIILAHNKKDIHFSFK